MVTRYPRRLGTKRKRYTVKRKRTMYRRKVVRGQFMQIKRTIYQGNWAPNTTTTAGFWRVFAPTLSDMGASANDFAALFDCYRIKALKVTLRPRFDNFAGNDTTDTTLPGVTNQSGTRVAIIVDPSTSTAPTGSYSIANFNTFVENGNVRFYEGLRPINIYFRPKVEQTIGGLSGARRVGSPWLQIGSTNILHWGFHCFMHDNAFSGTFGNSFDIFYTYYLQLKNVK